MNPGSVDARGILEITDKAFGFLRDPNCLGRQSPRDVFVPAELIRRFRLRPGLDIQGRAVAGHNRGGAPKLVAIDRVGPLAPADYAERVSLSEGTTVAPHEWIRLETRPEIMGPRVMDLMTPIGKGQRGLIVAPPRTGKTILLQQISQAVVTNHPEIHLMMLLVDERPEEVTEMRRVVRGEVIASSNDQDMMSHIRTTRLAIEKAKRLVEFGRDVLVLLDSITRVARTFNQFVGTSGRTLSGGVDSRAMEEPRRIFGSARKIEHGGSLTILATALVETGSRMDQVIFEEFKGTGNMELKLERKLADRRVWPAMDLQLSGTRREERLLPADRLRKIVLIRKALAGLNPVEAMERLVTQLAKFPSNAAFLEAI